MTWLVYENSDEATQLLVGVLIILAVAIVIVANIYFWISDKIKKSKK